MKAALLELLAGVSCGGEAPEEPGGGLVGVDAGRGEQSHQPARFDQAHGALHEQLPGRG